MTEFSLVENDVFAELHGIVLINVPLLEQLCGPETTGINLLDRFYQSTEGDQVCIAGAVIPILGISAEYYSIVIRSKLSPPSVANPKKSSSGWVFKADTGASILCGLGFLTRWNPKEAQHRQIAIPSGWYTVEFGVGFVQDDPNRWGVDFIFDAKPKKPEFTADPQTAFDLYLEDEAD